MSDSKLKPTHDIMWKSRTYKDSEGKDKNVWTKVGTLFSTPHGSGMSIKLDVVPVGDNFNGFLSVFERKEKDQGGGSQGGSDFNP